MSDPTADAVARAFRDERAAVLATLIRHVGDFQLAEDAVQDAYAAALTTWPRDGVPANPGAWLTVTARQRRSDRLTTHRRVPGLAGNGAPIQHKSNLQVMRLKAIASPRDTHRSSR